MSAPHAEQPVWRASTSLARAAGALGLLHGRGASARDVIGLGQFTAPAGWALLTPEAAGHTWYPYSFLASRERNE